MDKWFSLRNFPRVYNVFTCLNIKEERFTKYISLQIFVLLFLIFSTLCCMSKDDENAQERLSMHHDLLMLSGFLGYKICLFVNKTDLCALISFLVEPMREFEKNSEKSKIVNDFHRKVKIYGIVIFALIVSCVPIYSAAPTLLWLFNASKTNENNIELAFGWVKKIDSYWYISFMYLLSACGFMYTAFEYTLWHILILYTVLKIKCSIRLLCADLGDMNNLINCSEETGSPMYWEEESLIKTAPGPSYGPLNNESGQQKNKSQGNILSVDLQDKTREKIQKERIKLFVQNIVIEHVKIIQKVRLADKTFRLFLMVYTQTGTVMFALAVPKMKLDVDLVSFDHISPAAEIIVLMIFYGIICYMGQTLIDESERLRQALYDCDWTDKPYSLRRDLLIMQIAATRPLRLTVGGIYTLGLETYANVVNVTYSYISVIQSLK